ncbi:MAG: TOBE domain-containing protein [Rhodospirillales bacterium]|nr:TOBE domain-containing protein [Rhodospirillales bacterium]
MVRTEKLEILPDGNPGEVLNLVRGRVKKRGYRGKSFLFYIGLKNGESVAIRWLTRHETLASLPGEGEAFILGSTRKTSSWCRTMHAAAMPLSPPDRPQPTEKPPTKAALRGMLRARTTQRRGSAGRRR